MSDGPEWFAPKRFGYGAGLPISWQGWALTAAFMGFSIGLAIEFAERPVRPVRRAGPDDRRLRRDLRPHDARRLALALGRSTD